MTTETNTTLRPPNLPPDPTHHYRPSTEQPRTARAPAGSQPAALPPISPALGPFVWISPARCVLETLRARVSQ
jgi:hypothetical protein